MDIQDHSANRFGMNHTGTWLSRRSRALLLSSCLLALHAASAQAASNYYEDALRRFDAKDVNGAIVQLKNALHQDPENLPALVLLADASLMAGQASAAETALETAARLGADRSVIIPKLAQALLLQRKFRSLLDQVSTQGLSPLDASEILVDRGIAYMELGNLKKAEQTLNEAGKLSPAAVAVKVAQGSLMLRQGNLQGARATAERAVAMAPNDAGAWNLKASVSHLSGDIQAALAGYNKTLTLNPGNLDARLGRVGLLMDLKRDQEAGPDLKALQQVAEDDPRAAYLIALDAARRGDNKATQAALTQAATGLDQLPLESVQANPQLLMLGGLAYYGVDKLEQARSYLEKYISLVPRNLGARKLLASIMLENREYDAVIEMLYSVVNDKAPDPHALSLLASAYMGKKQYPQATELFERASRILPSATDSAIGLGMSQLGAGHLVEGAAQLQAVFSKNPGQSRAGLLLASTYLRQGEPAKAAEVARKLVANDPRNLTALNLLGTALAASRDPGGARAAFTKAARLQPNFLPVQLNIARLDFAEHKDQAARSRLNAILKASADNPDALLQLAYLEEREGHPGEAIRWLQRVRSGQTKALAPLLTLVEMYLKAGDAKNALAVAQELETVYPDDLRVLDAEGRAYQAAGNIDKARASFNIMAHDAGFASADLTWSAQRLMGVGAGDDAALALKKALINSPGYLPALFTMAELDLQAGRLEQAEKQASEIRNAHPGLSAAARLLCRVNLAQKKFAAAVQECKAAVAKEADGANTLALFQAYVAAGDSKTASEQMQAWLRVHPQDSAAQSALAEAYLRGGQLQQARAAYEAALKKRGKDVGVLNNLANISLKLDDPRALSYARQAYALAPGNPDIADTLGWVLVRNGQAQQALPYLRDASLRASQNAEIRYHLAEALSRLGRKAEARSELRKALATGRDFEGVADARALMQQL